MKRSTTILLAGGAFLIGGLLAFTIAGRVQAGKIMSPLNQIVSREMLKASGETISLNFPLENFTGLSTSLPGAIEVRQGKGWLVEAEVPENISEYLDFQVKGGILNLNSTRSVWYGSTTVVIKITMPELQLLKSSGAADISFTGFSGESLTIETSGAASIKGAGGSYKNLRLNNSGATDVNLEDLATENAMVDLSGVGRVSLSMAGGDLLGSISGAGQVVYSGPVRQQKVNLSGVGAVKER